MKSIFIIALEAMAVNTLRSNSHGTDTSLRRLAPSPSLLHATPGLNAQEDEHVWDPQQGGAERLRAEVGDRRLVGRSSASASAAVHVKPKVKPKPKQRPLPGPPGTAKSNAQSGVKQNTQRLSSSSRSETTATGQMKARSKSETTATDRTGLKKPHSKSSSSETAAAEKAAAKKAARRVATKNHDNIKALSAEKAAAEERMASAVRTAREAGDEAAAKSIQTSELKTEMEQARAQWVELSERIGNTPERPQREKGAPEWAELEAGQKKYYRAKRQYEEAETIRAQVQRTADRHARQASSEKDTIATLNERLATADRTGLKKPRPAKTDAEREADRLVRANADAAASKARTEKDAAAKKAARRVATEKDAAIKVWSAEKAAAEERLASAVRTGREAYGEAATKSIQTAELKTEMEKANAQWGVSSERIGHNNISERTKWEWDELSAGMKKYYRAEKKYQEAETIRAQVQQTADRHARQASMEEDTIATLTRKLANPTEKDLFQFQFENPRWLKDYHESHNPSWDYGGGLFGPLKDQLRRGLI